MNNKDNWKKWLKIIFRILLAIGSIILLSKSLKLGSDTVSKMTYYSN